MTSRIPSPPPGMSRVRWRWAWGWPFGTSLRAVQRRMRSEDFRHVVVVSSSDPAEYQWQPVTSIRHLDMASAKDELWHLTRYNGMTHMSILSAPDASMDGAWGPETRR